MQSATEKATTSERQKGVGYIDLPQPIKTKRAVINVENEDNICFECEILSALHHGEI